MRAKPIYSYNLDGTFHKGYKSSVEASNDIHIAPGSIRNATKRAHVTGDRQKCGDSYWSFTNYVNILTGEKAKVKAKPQNINQCPYCKSFNISLCGFYDRKTVSRIRRVKCKDCGKYFQYDTDVSRSWKRLVIISDTHCGHVTGLTPPEYNNVEDKHTEYRKKAWQWFSQTIRRLQPINIAIGNGDLIDGRQEKNGGNELLNCDRHIQVKMAARIVNLLEADKVYLSTGTPYHTGKLEGWENMVAEKSNAEIANIIKIDVNGCKINARHKTGRSSVPHGKYTQLALQSLWEDLKVVGTDEGKVNILIRSHVHYTSAITSGNNRLALTTPALQGATDYGEKECTGIVDFGITFIDIDAYGGIMNWGFRTTKLDEHENKYKPIYD